MKRLLSAAALAAAVAIGLAAPAEAAHCRYGHTARGGCAVHPQRSTAHAHRTAHAGGLRMRSSSWSPQQPRASLLQAPAPDTAPRRVFLGRPPVAPNVPNNLPPVNTPQPPL